MKLTTLSLIERCRIKARLNDSGGIFSDEDIIHHLNDQLQNRLVPFYMTFKADAFLSHQDFPYADTIQIPLNAINKKIARVEFLYPSSTTKIKYLQSPYPHEEGFYVEGDKIVLQNLPHHPIRLWFYRRPSFLTLSYTSIERIDKPNKQLILSHVPTSWDKNYYEINRDHVNDYGIVDTVLVKHISGNTLTLDALPSTIKKGDFISVLHTSPIGTIPYEASYLLILYTCFAFNLDTSLIINLEKEIPVIENRLRKMASIKVEDSHYIFSRTSLFNNHAWT